MSAKSVALRALQRAVSGSNWRKPLVTAAFLSGALMVSTWIVPSQLAAQQQPPGTEINSCKYLVVPDYPEDTWGFQPELRRQGQALGFVITADARRVPADDAIRACVILTTHFPLGEFFGPSNDFRVEVVDLISGARLGEAKAGTTIHLSNSGAAKARVKTVFRKLGYRGFSEAAVSSKVGRLYPPRPKVTVSEDEIRRRQTGSAIEGIWSDPESQYRIGIVPAPKESGADYHAVVLKSSTPVWQPGEIKGELHGTASSAVFTSTWFMLGKDPVRTTFTLESGMLRSSIKSAGSAAVTDDIVLVRVWPALGSSRGGAAVPPSDWVVSSGTAFAVSADGLLLTALHVVEGASSMTAKCGSTPATAVTLVSKSSTLDLAVLQMSEGTKVPYLDLVPEADMPDLGAAVFTVGFPATSVLGPDPKYTEGTISGLSGLEGDASFYQVSVAVQPGNSGGPLLDERGRVVGIVLSTASAPAFLRAVGTFPQNINWAVKARVATALFKATALRPAVGSRQEAIKRATSAVCMVRASKN